MVPYSPLVPFHRLPPLLHQPTGTLARGKGVAMLLFKILLRLLLSWFGVVVIAIVGTGIVVYGLAMGLKEEETEPTEVQVDQLDGEKPEKEWLKLTGGVVYWPESLTMVSELTRRGRKISSTEESTYVPLVSPEVRDEWLEVTVRSHGMTKLDYSKCRVLAVVRKDTPRDEFPRKPNVAGKDVDVDKLLPEFAPTGRVIPKNWLGDADRRELANTYPKLDLDRVLLVEVGSRPPTHTDRGLMILLGVLLLVPCTLKAIFGEKLSNWLYTPEPDDGERPVV